MADMGQSGDRPTAPLGSEAVQERLCSRIVARRPNAGEVHCQERASVHIIYWWDETPAAGSPGYDHGFACDEHWVDFQRRWRCESHHPISHACGMPGSLLHVDGEDSWCTVDDLPVAEPVRAIAEAVLT